jgi:riboflavin kinase/FMN adenylyltransferase
MAVALSIGSYDGVHLGHRALIARAREHAGPDGRVIVLAFDPHPLTALRPGFAPPRLTTFDLRARLVREAGADEVHRLVPDSATLSLTPDAFAGMIASRYRPDVIVEGRDFSFGRKRAGTIETLRALGSDLGFDVDCVPPVEAALTDHTIVRSSSSVTRWLLKHGRVWDARIILGGRRHRVDGLVQRGQQRGRTIGVPTANLAPTQMLPADGVYAAIAHAPDGKRYAAAVNVGPNPTFDEQYRHLEAHLLDYEHAGPEYDWPLAIDFFAHLRDAAAFAGVPDLVAQIGRDVERTRSLVSSVELHAASPLSTHA